MIPDSKSFLFTLVNHSGNQPIKITPKPDAATCIRCSSNHGPTFGDSKFSDLQVYAPTGRDGGHGVTYTTHLSVGHGFTCPENVKNAIFLTGVVPSKVSELEVFKVNL